MPTTSVVTEDLYATEVIAGDWRQRITLDDLQQHGARNSAEEIKQCRLQYQNYFLNGGHVNW
jgi:hypothetical protein